METNFWIQVWNTNNIGFNQQEPSPPSSVTEDEIFALYQQQVLMLSKKI